MRERRARPSDLGDPGDLGDFGKPGEPGDAADDGQVPASGSPSDPGVPLGPLPLPHGWKLCTLRQLCKNEGRYGSPAAAQPYSPDLPRYIRITDIDRDGYLRHDSLASIASADAGPYLLSAGDLLVARSGATVGKAYLYSERDGVCAHGGYLIRFPVRTDLCEPEFLFRWLQSAYYKDWLGRTVRQAAQPNINAVELGALTVPLPPLAEQRRIAGILARADRMGRVTRRLVTKLEHLRLAMLHELLTRGRRADGTPHPPESLRATPLGPLPAAWTVAPLESLLAPVDPAMRSGPFGSALLKSELVDDGYPLLGIDNVGVDEFIPRYKRFVTRKKFLELQRYAVNPGDVMVTIMGTVGRACVVPARVFERALSSKHVWTLTIDTRRYLPALLSMQLNHARWVRSHFRRYEQGGTMTALSSAALRETLLPVPPLEEQERIQEALLALTRRLAAERKLLVKYRHTRQALLEDLMLGRVRAC